MACHVQFFLILMLNFKTTNRPYMPTYSLHWSTSTHTSHSLINIFSFVRTPRARNVNEVYNREVRGALVYDSNKGPNSQGRRGKAIWGRSWKAHVRHYIYVSWWTGRQFLPLSTVIRPLFICCRLSDGRENSAGKQTAWESLWREHSGEVSLVPVLFLSLCK